MTHNIFNLFKCHYKEPKHDWLAENELKVLQDAHFEERTLNEIRDIFLFSSYTGFSYQEVYNLSSYHLKKRDDGELWATISRQKTNGDESVPLLPPAIKLIEQYKDHPITSRRNRLFPVPSNQAYNRGLKEIAALLNINITLRTHKARFYFANEVTFNNGVDLKTVSRMLGHQSIKTRETYVRSNQRNVSESMKMVKEKLFPDKVKTTAEAPNLPTTHTTQPQILTTM